VVDEQMILEHWWNDNDNGKLQYSEKACHSTIKSITKSTWTDLEMNPCLCGKS